MKRSNKTIREYGIIWKQSEERSEIEDTFDQLYLSPSDFDNILHFIEDNQHTGIEKSFQVGRSNGRSYIRVKNYVGIIETKHGTVIEILPKVYGYTQAKEENAHKSLFLNMLSCLKDTPFIALRDAHLNTRKFPILEVFIALFLAAIEQLLKTGLQKDYAAVQGNQPFLKGKLLFHEQQKRNLLKPYQFYIEQDDFILNNPPNRLLKTCLRFLLTRSKSAKHQNLIRRYLLRFDHIPMSNNLVYDLQQSNRKHRLYQHYRKLLGWSVIFLRGQSFTNFRGKHLNQALLFPMERIFEDYIGTKVKQQLSDYTVHLQDQRFHLVKEHLGKPKFRLRPDIVLSKGNRTIIIDTKWKIINQYRPKANYDIAQSDMYQLFGYGSTYRQSGQDLTLILLYPLQEQLTAPLPPFRYDDEGLTLHVLPFDLSNTNVQKEIQKLIKCWGLKTN